MNPADEDIAQRIASGDAGAFDAFFERYATRLLSYVDGLLRDRAAAEDLVQETAVRVWRHIGRYRADGGFRPWVYRIATNLALTELRRRRYRAALPLEGAVREIGDAEAADPGRVLEREERLRLLDRGLARLPDDQRVVVMMRIRGEMSLAEIATALRVPEGTVKSRLHHAVRRLRAGLRCAAGKENIHEAL